MDSKIEQAVVELKQAIEGIGTDEKVLIDVVTNYSIIERQKIKTMYKSKYKTDLIQDLKDELHSKFETTMVALFTNPIDYDAEQLHSIIEKSSPDVESLIEIIAPKPNWILQKIKEQYKVMFKKEIEEDLTKLKEEEKQLLLGLLQCKRNENDKPDFIECSNKAKQLFDCDTKLWKNNDSLFYKILNLSSP